MSEVETWIAIAGLTGVTLLTRSFFLLSDSPWPVPRWAREALQVAPLAALVAVIAPEIVLVQGSWPQDWRDARWPAVLAATLFYYKVRPDILGTILTGMLVLLALRMGLGW